MTVQEWLAQARAQLAAHVDNAAQEVEWLLEEVLSVPRLALYQAPERLLLESERTQVDALLARRLQGEPLAYILQHTAFWRFDDWVVTPDTLVPRPETEHLVEWILAQALMPNTPIVELGTGTGVVLLTLLSERPAWRGIATDVSDPALAVARMNAERRGVMDRVQFLQGDWFDALPPDTRYALIVSNPPYLRADDVHLQQLSYEPLLALVGGLTGLETIEWIVQQSIDYLQPGGMLVIEHGFDQGEAVVEIFIAAGLIDVISHRDLAGHTRFVTGKAS